ncbi:hypothetical protein MF672_029100 [Actinomadura sp. ATCC 31491]|uniref:Phosphopantetheine adenylyltransferase n=1 Tax=Actinomadura luzonensis TaxID=2805427 RepID=A0ABT0FZR1_9ACTN|nr:hypothetical protein [Actinomadura luzonensis]MCK2217823.1 hypothetical protein [Actinomadura luzonensis]
MPLPARAEPVARVVLVLIGLITTLPAAALVNAGVLDWNYGVADPSPTTLALLQHRGMLQLLLGAALVWAGLHPPVRFAAAVAAVAGKSTFLALMLPDAAIRADLSPLSVWFDLTCVVVLGAFAAYLGVRRLTGGLATER